MNSSVTSVEDASRKDGVVIDMQNVWILRMKWTVIIVSDDHVAAFKIF